MSRHRFFLTDEIHEQGCDSELPLTAADRHHLASVLRVRPGEELVGVTPSGHSYVVRVSEVSPDRVVAAEFERLPAVCEPRVTLVLGVSKGGKVDDVVEGAVEVGVAAVVPVLCARSVVRMDSEKRAERGARWRRVALAAAKQSQRSFVPRVDDPLDLDGALKGIAAHDLVVVAWEDARGVSGVRGALAAASLTKDASVAVVVGPEGGLTAEEVSLLRERCGGVEVTLGPTILRTETAGVVAAALVIHELGGLGNLHEG